MPRLSAAAVPAAAMLAACGAAPSLRPATLDPKTAASIQVGVVGGAARFCPGGAAVQLDVAVATTDGRVLDSWSSGEGRAGRLPFSTFEWTTSWGAVDGDGFVRLPDDPLAAIGRTVAIEVRVAERPDLRGQVTLTPDFGCGGSVGGSGIAGTSGFGGSSGAPGAGGRADDGSHGAETGQRGGPGDHGSHGGDGGPGPAVVAWLGYVETGGERLAILRARVHGQVQTAVFDPAGEPWAVVAFGGQGGSGGRGGDGGPGGTGGAGRAPTSGSSGSGSGSSEGDPGSDGGDGGDGGQGGDGGDGGDGGPGGGLELTYDAAFPELATLVVTDTRGGAAGDGGYPGGGGQGGSGGTGARRGRDGQPGAAGRSGSDGREGAPGTAPVVRAGDIRAAFSDLAERGLVLAAPR
jgi:hypothetical protein